MFSESTSSQFSNRNFPATKNSSRKLPRVLLASPREIFGAQALNSVQLIWPDHQESPVYDISHSGLVVGNQVTLLRPKLNQSFEFKLKIRGLEDLVSMKAQLMQIQETSFGFAFETFSVENRLIIEQNLKDAILSENLRLMRTPFSLLGGLDEIWLHGPFDTNLNFRLNSNLAVDFAQFEYDNVIWRIENSEISIQKSPAKLGEDQAYSSKIEKSLAKVSLGASWMERLIKCFERAGPRLLEENSNLNLKPVIEILKQQIKFKMKLIPPARNSVKVQSH